MNSKKKTAVDSARAIPMAEFVIAALVLLLLEAFLFYHFFTGPRITAASETRTELDARRVALANYRNDKLGAESLNDQLNDLLSQIDMAEKKLPPALHNEDIAAMIGQYSRIHNITLESVSFQERQLVNPSEYVVAPDDDSGSGAGNSSAAGSGAGGSDNAFANAGADPYADPYANAEANGFADEIAKTDSNVNSNPNANVNAGIYTIEDSGLIALGNALPSVSYDGAASAKTLSLQSVQINFTSEFHTAGAFIKSFEESERRVRIRSASFARVQEGELKGVLNLEYAALSPDAERISTDLEGGDSSADISSSGDSPTSVSPSVVSSADEKESLFGKYNGFIEDDADPTILLLSGEDDIDPDFYIVLKSSSSNETKVSYGVYPRVETELRSNVNNAVRAKLTIGGDEEQFEYTYTLASNEMSEKRKLAAADGKLRLKVLSCQRVGDNDNVSILLDIENNTDLPFDIIVINDDVLSPRLHIGITKGNVNVVDK